MLILSQILTGTVKPSDISDQQMDVSIRQARKALLLPQLAALLKQQNALDPLPKALARQLRSALIVNEAHRRAVLWEFDRLQAALKETLFPIVFLKGAAYLAQKMPHAEYRMYGDIDLLVPKDNLAETEERLKWHGWTSNVSSRYDQIYYRKWMHELPPLQHSKRGSVLDIHHRILPPTSRITVAGEPLLNSSKAVDGYPFFRVLSPVDQLLHSAAHLFSDGECDHAYRDLFDIHQLIQWHQPQVPDYLEKCMIRANALGLSRWLFLALRYLRIVFWPELEGNLKTPPKDRPSALVLQLHDWVYHRCLRPQHASCSRPISGLAKRALYLRGHYLRMPLRLLIPHLVRKSFNKDKPATLR